MYTLYCTDAIHFGPPASSIAFNGNVLDGKQGRDGNLVPSRPVRFQISIKIPSSQNLEIPGAVPFQILVAGMIPVRSRSTSWISVKNESSDGNLVKSCPT